MLGYNPKSDSKEAWEWFSNLCTNTRQTQEIVLSEILKNANKSEIAQKYNFNSIKNIEDFRKVVPMSEWSDYEEASMRMQEGEENILFNNKPEVFIMTSGTTGKSKMVPETKTSIFLKSVTDKIRQYFSMYPYPELKDGKILPLGNSEKLGQTSAGIPFGTASGITFANMSKDVAKKFAYPLEILQIEDSKIVDYLLMRFSIEEDVRFLVGNNLARMEKLSLVAKKFATQICDDIEKGTISKDIIIDNKIRNNLSKYLSPNPKRAKELRSLSNKDFLPKNYWPNFKVVCCWLSASVGLSVDSVKYLFPKDTIYLDYGYGATEGKFNIPSHKGKSFGPLTIHSAFYEFSSIDEPDKFLLADELEVDKDYNMFITNFSGFYRYNLKDIIRVKSYYYTAPEIEFVSKSGDIGNICGEKLESSTIVITIEKIVEKFGFLLTHIEAYPNQNPPRYYFYIELKGDKKVDLEKLTKAIDLGLQNDLGYKHRRRDNLLLEPKIIIMPNGWVESIYNKKLEEGISRAQLKLPVIRKTPIKL